MSKGKDKIQKDKEQAERVRLAAQKPKNDEPPEPEAEAAVVDVEPARKPTLTDREFVCAWQSAESLQALADKTGRSCGSLNCRAIRYRKHGVELKTFPRKNGGKATDWNALADLAKNIADTGVEASV